MREEWAIWMPTQTWDEGTAIELNGRQVGQHRLGLLGGKEPAAPSRADRLCCESPCGYRPPDATVP